MINIQDGLILAREEEGKKEEMGRGIPAFSLQHRSPTEGLILLLGQPGGLSPLG